MTPDIADLLDGKVPKAMFPAVDAELIIGRYSAGHGIAVSRKSAEGAQLEKLEGLDEVWALCFRKPAPGWRVFGRFTEKNTFVAVQAYDRHELGAKANYSRLAEEVAQRWDDHIRLPVVRGLEISDYITGVYFDLDKETDDD